MPTADPHRRSEPRRTQEQRTADMRLRLLDATIDCLVEYGYSGTTTLRVARRAGVSRGAQLHHFQSKTELVISAIHHLAAKRADAVIRGMGTVDSTDDPVARILELLWDVHQGPLFIATVELWVAGRSDPALGQELAKFEPVVSSNLLSALAQGFPGREPGRELVSFIYTAMDTIRGILLSNFVERDLLRARRQWDRAMPMLHSIGLTAMQSV